MKIIPYHAAYQAALPEISLAWLKQYDILEDLDVEMVNHPERILDSGSLSCCAKVRASISAPVCA